MGKLDELKNMLKENDKHLAEWYKDCDELTITKFINQLKLEYYFDENVRRMNDEIKELNLIPNKGELNECVTHRITFKHGDSKIHYDVYK